MTIQCALIKGGKIQTLTEADEAVFQNAVKDGLKFQTAECNWDEGT